MKMYNLLIKNCLLKSKFLNLLWRLMWSLERIQKTNFAMGLASAAHSVRAFCLLSHKQRARSVVIIIIECI